MRQHRAAAEISTPPAPSANDTGGMVLIGAAQLADIVRTAVAEALESQGPAGGRKLLSRVELARALSCSPTQVDKQRRAGLPHLRVGDSPRYDLDECIAWLRTTQKGSER